MTAKVSQAAIPQILIREDRRAVAEVLAIITGIALMSLLARISIQLPWTPVPITGQTLGVALVALSWGRQRAFAVIMGYLALGVAGLPVFAVSAGGATVGYLIGMTVASLVVGELADRGFTKSPAKSLLAAFTGSAIIFSFGLFVLSFYVPRNMLLTSGLLPFLPGDILKNLIAATVSWRIRALKP